MIAIVATPGPGTERSVDLNSDDTVMVFAGQDHLDSVLDEAGRVGARVVVHDLVDAAPGGIAAKVRDSGTTVLNLPGLMGRWIPPEPLGDGETRLRLVLLHGNVVDPASKAGVRSAFGHHVLISVRPDEAADRPWWELEAALEECAGVSEALVGAPSTPGGSLTVWLAPAEGASIDHCAVKVALGSSPVDVRVVDHQLRSPDGSRVCVAVPGGWSPRSSRLGPVVAPEDHLESTLVACLEMVTQTSPLGTADGFSELGGDGSVAAWIVDEVEQRTGFRLRASELLDHPTMAELARVVRRDQDREVRRPVTATLAEPVAGAPTLCVVHGVDGSPYPLVPLAEIVSCGVVAFESPVLGGAPSPFRSLDLMALRYLADVRRLQPRGPYFLAGWGFGGHLAYEMVRQLAAEGEEVAILAVVDAGPGAQLPRSDSGSVRRRGAHKGGKASQRVPLTDRSDHARVAHQRLEAVTSWPDGPALDLTLHLSWSSDVGSADATMGWGSLVDPDRIVIDRLTVEHVDSPDSDAVREWAKVLDDAIAIASPAPAPPRAR